MPGENPVASNGPDGADNIVAELASGVVAEGWENTSANHQPSSSVVPEIVRSASTSPMLDPNENEQKNASIAPHAKPKSPLHLLLQ